MTAQEYRVDLIQQARLDAEANNDSTVTAFVNYALEMLVNLEILPGYEGCYAEPYGRKNRKTRIDAYYYDDFDNVLYMIIADFDGGEEPGTLTRTSSKAIFDRLEAFVDETIHRNMIDVLEMSSPVYDLASMLLDKSTSITKYIFILVTDRISSERLDNIPSSKIDSTPVEYNVWDVSRFLKVNTSDLGKEEIEVDFSDSSNSGLPCLDASYVDSGDYRSYLCVMPGNILADIYGKYGSRLLEGNIRSFLTTKRAVNRKIRETLLRLPERFFAYNNGISATASSVVTETLNKGTILKKIYGLQIVNGGQTTASIYNAKLSGEAKLDRVFVPMKLTCVEPKLAQEVIPEISRSSNSQNKVSEADFFSNHPFHIEMERMSRRLFAPASHGNQYGTRWFYERATGQYTQEQARLSKSEKKKFLLENPSNQKFTKTELAKVINTYRMLPHKVSLGAQKNFSVFAEWIASEWDQDKLKFNEVFFKESVAKLILFNDTRRIIKDQPWYENGYLANITTYSIAKLLQSVQKQYPRMEIDLTYIWQKQEIHNTMKMQLIEAAKTVYQKLTDVDRGIQNITEWSKSPECWRRIQETDLKMISAFETILMDIGESRDIHKQAKKEQKMISGLEAQMSVFSKGKEYWGKMIEFAKSRILISDEDLEQLMTTQRMSSTFMPNEVQSRKILIIRERMMAEGFPE